MIEKEAGMDVDRPSPLVPHGLDDADIAAVTELYRAPATAVRS